MRLSDAIALGRTLRKGGNGWSFCDCALGLAQAAVGIPYEKRHASTAVQIWPWLAPNGSSLLNGKLPLNEVSSRYSDVAKGKSTLDELIDYVRSVEPPELEEVANGGRTETISETKPLCAK